MGQRVTSTAALATSAIQLEKTDWDGLVTIAVYSTSVEAGVARSALESSGIPAFLRDEAPAGVVSFLGQPVEGVRVVVPADHAAAARNILGAPLELEQAEADVSAVEEPDRLGHADDLALKAWRSAVFGFFLPFIMHLWSIHLL